MMRNIEHCQQYYEYSIDSLWRLNTVLKFLPKEITGTLADLGTGPGELPKLIHDKCPNIQIDAYDGSPAMLEIARNHIGNTDRIKLLHKDFRTVSKKYDYIVSVFTLHQIHNPDTFWQAVKNMSKQGSEIIIIDLVQPSSERLLEEIVTKYWTLKDRKGLKSPLLEQRFPSILENGFRNSYKAAFTLAEIREQVKQHLPLLEVGEIKGVRSAGPGCALIKTVPKL